MQSALKQPNEGQGSALSIAVRESTPMNTMQYSSDGMLRLSGEPLSAYLNSAADMANALARQQPAGAHCHRALEDVLRTDERYLRTVHGEDRTIAIGFSGLPSAPSVRADLSAADCEDFTIAPVHYGNISYGAIPSTEWDKRISERNDWVIRKHVAITDPGEVFALTLTESYHIDGADPTSQMHPFATRTTEARYRVAFNQLLAAVDAPKHQIVRLTDIVQQAPVSTAVDVVKNERSANYLAMRETAHQLYRGTAKKIMGDSHSLLANIAGPFAIPTWNRYLSERSTYKKDSSSEHTGAYLVPIAGAVAGLFGMIFNPVVAIVGGSILGGMAIGNVGSALYEKYRTNKLDLQKQIRSGSYAPAQRLTIGSGSKY